jgi:alkaline phosphatase D
MKNMPFSAALIVVLLVQSSLGFARIKQEFGMTQGMYAGEVTSSSVILQSRLTFGPRQLNGNVHGHTGVAQFEISRTETFSKSTKTQWLDAKSENDYIIKTVVDKLDPDTRYYYRLIYGKNKNELKQGEVYQFKTNAGEALSRAVSFTALTCLNYDKFFFTGNNREPAYSGADKMQGYPALSYIPWMKSDFVIYNGDNVYYDNNTVAMEASATVDSMRFRWHRQFSLPRLLEIQKTSASYWLKDDHDFRFNDGDLVGDRDPSPELGIKIFREQTPIVDPNKKDAVTYRTHRVSKELQLWFVENRDYRSPNKMKNGPGKSMWGKKQKAWLKRTLLGSDANFKVIITPTPMVGPDRNGKIDNHASLRGFSHEGDQFMDWLADNKFSGEEVMWITGDRHWQYHSIHPVGFSEFSSGSISYANAQQPVHPGDKGGTDPKGLVEQPYVNESLLGGFLQVNVTPAAEKNAKAELSVQFVDEWGRKVYQTTKHR